MSENRGGALLVLHAGALGDCVLTLHLLQAMRASWGDPAITMAARSPIVHWAKRRGFVAEAISLDAMNAHLLYDNTSHPTEELVRFLQRFDRVVSFLGGHSETVSVRLGGLCRGEVHAVDPRPRDETIRLGRHITEQWADDLALKAYEPDYAGHGWDHLELPEGTGEAEVPPAGAWGANKAACRKLLASRLGVQAEPSIVLCHPGSGGLAKCCPIEALEELLASFAREGWTIAWMVGPDEFERFGPGWVKRFESIAPVVFEESVEMAADLARGSDLYIGNDAGMTHVAAIAGVRTIALFGSTDPSVWRSLGRDCHVAWFPTAGGSTEFWIRKICAAAFVWGTCRRRPQ